ncbi:MAG: DUF2460 domain-containing protein [Bryobacteraceae bacterium]
MLTFPTLKSGAVLQYPAERRVVFQTDVMRFLDGKEQRYRNSPSPLHSWTIHLDLLDEEELAALDTFFLSSQGSFGSFSFTDPWDGTVYPNCSLENDSFEWNLESEMRGRTALTVSENRS